MHTSGIMKMQDMILKYPSNPGVNCTNFISACLNGGGGVGMDWRGTVQIERWFTQKRNNGSWSKTTTWSVAHDYVFYSRRNSDAGGLAACVNKSGYNTVNMQGLFKILSN
ncbi:amidase domain-containing protein [Peptococcaceae bacterium]|nr:amidase domain-containing protein [Peptococcaceae bacterium]